MVLSHIYGDIATRCRWKNEERIDNQNSNPFNRKHDNESNQYRKQIFHRLYRNMFTLCNSPVNTDRIQIIKPKQPKL